VINPTKKEKSDKKADKKADDKKKAADKPAEDETPKAAETPKTPKDEKTAAAGAGADEAVGGADKAQSSDPAADAAGGVAGSDEKAAPAAAEPLDPQSALRAVLRTSLFHDGLARGLHESVKALDRREAHLCVLSTSCNEPAYVKLITALCSEHSIPLIKIEESKLLGEWVGLCKFNAESKAVKVVGCSCAVIRSWGEETAARQYILEHIKTSS